MIEFQVYIHSEGKSMHYVIKAENLADAIAGAFRDFNMFNYGVPTSVMAYPSSQ